MKLAYQRRIKRQTIITNYINGWDAFYLTVTPERCEGLPMGGRLPGVIQLENRERVLS